MECGTKVLHGNKMSSTVGGGLRTLADSFGKETLNGGKDIASKHSQQNSGARIGTRTIARTTTVREVVLGEGQGGLEPNKRQTTLDEGLE